LVISDLEAGRAPVTDYNRLTDALMSNYRKEIDRNVSFVNEDSWIAHVVQKEAIQNSSDALDRGSTDKWLVLFEMDEAFPVRFVTVTDQGTCGLTGKTIIPKNELDRLEESEPNKYQYERWARFEALSFPNIDPIGKGSKGQGKWTFIGASNTKTIFYDTLRKDGIYRVGAWLGQGQLMKEPIQGDVAKQLIKEKFNLSPLAKVGTRIVIVNPKPELVNGFYPVLKSHLAEYIKETWWEALKDGASIFIKRGKYSVKVENPPYYRDEFIQKNGEETLIVKDCRLDWARNPKAKAKELAIIYSSSAIPEGFTGIAIQRNGMKIRSFDVRTENPAITPEISEHIYGWIKFNEEGEKELRTIEDTTHYDFSSSIGSFGIHVFGRNGWLVQQVREFAEQKLGLGLPEKSKSERSDILAVNRLNKFARKHNLAESGRAILGDHDKGPKQPQGEIRIKMPKPTFPHIETRRVEYGETVSNIVVSVINGTSESRKMRLTLVLKTASRKGIPERTLKGLVAKELIVPANGQSEEFGPYKITFNKFTYTDGAYALEAEIVLLEGDVLDDKFGKGMVLDQERELVYLNENPPAGNGLFELIDKIEFTREKTLQYRTRVKDGRLRIEINTIHPAYRHAEEIDDLLSKHRRGQNKNVPNPLVDYAIQIGAEAIALYDLKKEANLISDADAKKRFIEQRKEDKAAFYEEAMDRISRTAQEIRHEIL
jgi:hypothetical protein